MKAVLLFLFIAVTNTKCSERNNKALLQDTSSCEIHDHCPDSKACINGVCGDPCESLCGQNTYCTTLQHIPACACKDGHAGNPFIRCNLQEAPVNQPPPSQGKKRFYVETSKSAEWLGAFMMCLRNNSKLASVESKEELDEIRQLVRLTGLTGHDLYFWTAGTDYKFEGQFIWATTGKKLPSKSDVWLGDNPDNWDNKEHCVELRVEHATPRYGLNDTPCEHVKYYICEYYS